MQYVERRLKDIHAYKNNPRRNDDAVARVAESIRQFGFLVPIVITSDGEIVAGHTRYRAAHSLKMDKVPCILAEGLSDEQIRAFRIADNKVAEASSWNEEMLASELRGIADIDMTQFGFDVEGLFSEFPVLPDDDGFDAEQAVKKESKGTRAKKGKMYALGEHRLLVGDATDAKDMERLMAGKKADLVITDPPYGVDYQGGYTDEDTGEGMKILNDALDPEEMMEFLVKAFTNMQNALKGGGSYYVWYASTLALTFYQAIEASNLPVRQNLIWVKSGTVLGRQDYNWKHEPCLYGWKGGAKHYFYEGFGENTVFDNRPNPNAMNKQELVKLCKDLMDKLEDKIPKDVLYFDKQMVSDLHPTMKPIPLIARLMRNSSKENDIVLDPFGGSGTTLIAAEQLKRRCRMMELDPKYADVIIERWEKLTGKKAEQLK